MKILIVDDSLTTSSAVRFICQHMGYYDIEVANDGAEAISMLEADEYNVVIVEWSIPVISGVVLVQWMREQPTYENTPVIMLTFKDQAEDVLTAVESGVNEYVLKPLDKEVVRTKIRKVTSPYYGRRKSYLIEKKVVNTDKNKYS